MKINLANLLVHKNQKQRNYLFVGGCARSGTSVLTVLIGSNSQVVLGKERYNKLCNKQTFSLSTGHFKKERFFNVLEGDTFYTNFNDFHTWDAQIYSKFEHCKYVGIKYTRIHTIMDELLESFGKITVFYIYRNIFDVAESWNKRAEKANNWPKTKNYREAVIEWNESLSAMKTFIEKGHKIICVNYDDLFFSTKSIKPLFTPLQLKVAKITRQKIVDQRKRAKLLKEEKGSLTKEEIDYIEEYANLELFQYYDENLNVLRNNNTWFKKRIHGLRLSKKGL